MPARLADNQLEELVWRKVLGMSTTEIAAQLGMNVNTIYSRLRIARERLKLSTTLELVEYFMCLQIGYKTRQEFEASPQAELFVRGFSNLSPRLRTTLELLVSRPDLTLAGIARVLQVKEATVKTYQQRICYACVVRCGAPRVRLVALCILTGAL